jgi:hypothetical protein
MPAEIVPGGLSLPPGLHVSFQRYARPARDVIAKAPSSLGALPLALALGTTEVAVPVAPDEAFWIGLEMKQPGVRAEVAVRYQSQVEPAVDALSGTPWSEQHPTWLKVPTYQSIEGIALSIGGFRPFARARPAQEDDATAVLDLMTRADGMPGGSATTRVVLVDYSRFETTTGRQRPTPLDPDAQYQGWLLP